MKLDANLFPEIVFPGRKSRAQKRAERLARGKAIELARAPGDGKGWEIVESEGIPTWQMVEGGWFQPI